MAISMKRRFPSYGWAWPTGSLHQLLKAAISPNADEAFRCALDWLDGNDLDHVSFREHRLLAGVSTRFGSRLSLHPAYARLLGLQKMLWTRSLLGMQEIEPTLLALVNLGFPIMLLKRASMIASGAIPRRGRFANDTDILVRPQDIDAVFQSLVESGWQASLGISPPLLKSRLRTIRSVNLFRGRFGDLDLHASAYDWLLNRDDDDDRAIWERSNAMKFQGMNVLVPSPADRIAVAIAHGGLDGHIHSDWLVDCATTAGIGGVEWPVLLDIVARRRLGVPATVALSYLSDVGAPVPAGIVQQTVAIADRSGFRRWSDLFEAKPRTDLGPMPRLVRVLAKKFRLRATRAHLALLQDDTTWHARRARCAERSSAPFLVSHSVPVPVHGAGEFDLDLRIRVTLPPVARRLEIEINAGWRHIARLRYQTIFARGGEIVLGFRGAFRLAETESLLTIEGRPSRVLRGHHTERMMARYAPLPFQIVAANFSARAVA